MTQPRPIPPDQTFRELTQSLLSRTRQKEVVWVKVNRVANAYEVVLPRSRIVLTFSSPPTDPDYYVLELQNADRVTVGAWEVEDPVEPRERLENPDWQLVSDLFTEAHKIASGWDVVLSDVQAALRKPGSIGLNRVGSAMANPNDEDIPF